MKKTTPRGVDGRVNVTGRTVCSLSRWPSSTAQLISGPLGNPTRNVHGGRQESGRARIFFCSLDEVPGTGFRPPTRPGYGCSAGGSSFRRSPGRICRARGDVPSSQSGDETGRPRILSSFCSRHHGNRGDPFCAWSEQAVAIRNFRLWRERERRTPGGQSTIRSHLRTRRAVWWRAPLQEARAPSTNGKGRVGQHREAMMSAATVGVRRHIPARA